MKTVTTKLLLASVSAAVFMTACSDSASEKAAKIVKQAPTVDTSFAKVKSSDTSAVVATKTGDSLTDVSPESDIWEDATFSNVVLYPQTAISFNDKKSIELNKNNGAKTAKVAALFNDKEIAVAIMWKDATNDVFQGDTTDTYADGVAMQFAKTTNPAKLPYIGMGSEGREVAIYLQKAQYNTFEPNGNGNVDLQVSRNQTNHYDQFGSKDLTDFDTKVANAGSDDYERVFVSAGFRSMTEVRGTESKSNMKISRTDDGWMATLVRPIKDGLADLSKSFPVAFATWDGAKNNRNGLKLLSGWNAVTLGATNDALVKSINESVKGDLKNGAEQAAMNCGACHKFPGSFAPDYMAPDLSNIGGYATAAYIKESIIAPNAIIVPGYNRNAHKNTPWYTMAGKKRMSTMPAFDYLDAKSINDIVAYFQSLKAKGE